MKRNRIFFVIVLMFLLTGCQIMSDDRSETASGTHEEEESVTEETSANILNAQTVSESENQEKTTDTADTGVYYPKLEKELVSQWIPEEGGAYNSYLYYNGSVYSACSWYIFNAVNTEEDEIEISDILYTEIGTVYSNKEYYWSTDENDLYTTTSEGTLYQIKGFDAEYRVGVVVHVCLEATNPKVEYDQLIIFDKNNDMYLETGKEFFCDRLQLQAADKLLVTKYTLSEDKEKWEYSEQKELYEEDILQILGEWSQVEFIPAADEVHNDREVYYSLEFVHDGGIHTYAFLYEDGFLEIEGIAAKTDIDIEKFMDK